MDDGAQERGQPPAVQEEANEAVQRMLDFIKKLRPEGKKVHGCLCAKTRYRLELTCLAHTGLGGSETPSFLFRGVGFTSTLTLPTYRTLFYRRARRRGMTSSSKPPLPFCQTYASTIW